MFFLNSWSLLLGQRHEDTSSNFNFFVTNFREFTGNFKLITLNVEKFTSHFFSEFPIHNLNRYCPTIQSSNHAARVSFYPLLKCITTMRSFCHRTTLQYNDQIQQRHSFDKLSLFRFLFFDFRGLKACSRGKNVTSWPRVNVRKYACKYPLTLTSVKRLREASFFCF